MLFCVPEASLSSGDKQLEGIMASLSVCRVCSLYVSHHSDFDILKSFFFFYLRDTTLMCINTQNGFNLDASA